MKFFNTLSTTVALMLSTITFAQSNGCGGTPSFQLTQLVQRKLLLITKTELVKR